jgi:hypothetical protein
MSVPLRRHDGCAGETKPDPMPPIDVRSAALYDNTTRYAGAAVCAFRSALNVHACARRRKREFDVFGMRQYPRKTWSPRPYAD